MTQTAHNGSFRVKIADHCNGDKALLSQAQRQPFIKIANRVIPYAGSVGKAAELLGVCDNTMRDLLADKVLTSRTGHRILAQYKLIKHHL